MAVNATVVYRVRAGGNNANGGGYDPSISGAILTTLSGSLSAGATSMSLASLTNLPTSGSYYLHIGPIGAETTAGNSEVVLVTGAASNPLTIARGQLGTTAQAWASGTNVDGETSRCNTAVFSGTTGATVGVSATMTDTSGVFNSAMVGLSVFITSGTNFTVGAYTILTVNSATSITLDRNVATGIGLNGVYKIGGAWADYRTNLAVAYMVPGYTQYVRGSGTNSPNPASPDYTFATATLAQGSNAAGFSRIISEFGRASVKGSTNTVFTMGANCFVSGFYFCGAVTGSTAVLVTATFPFVYDCVFDQNGFDQTLVNAAGAIGTIYGCEFFNSGSAPAAANVAVNIGSSYSIRYSNFHNITASAISGTSVVMEITNNIFSNCGADVVSIAGAPGTSTIVGNTFDAGAGHGIIFSGVAQSILSTKILNNIFTNFTQAGKYAINGSVNTQALNDREKGIIDFNTFYNNTANYNAITAGANDTQLTVDPYVSQSTQDYTLKNRTLFTVGYPTTSYPQHSSGKTSPRSYVSPGAVIPLNGMPDFVTSYLGGMS